MFAVNWMVDWSKRTVAPLGPTSGAFSTLLNQIVFPALIGMPLKFALIELLCTQLASVVVVVGAAVVDVVVVVGLVVEDVEVGVVVVLELVVVVLLVLVLVELVDVLVDVLVLLLVVVVGVTHVPLESQVPPAPHGAPVLGVMVQLDVPLQLRALQVSEVHVIAVPTHCPFPLQVSS